MYLPGYSRLGKSATWTINPKNMWYMGKSIAGLPAGDKIAACISEAVPIDYPSENESLGLLREVKPRRRSSDSADSLIVPVAYVRPALPLTSLADDMHNVIIRTSGNARVSEGEPAIIRLSAGECLLHAQRRVTVLMGDCQAVFEPDTIVVVSKSKAVAKIQVLHDRSANSCVVTMGGRAIALSSGEELVIGSSDLMIANAIEGDGVGRRKVQYQKVADHLYAMRCEMSPVSLIQSCGTLRTVIRSGSVDDRAIRAKIFKMAASLMTVTARHGAFKQS
jgi:hypothetical protein